MSQLEELRRLTRPLILHRRKQQVVDLPPKQRRHHPIVLPDDTSIGFDHRVDLVVEDYRRRAQLGEVRSDAEPLAVLTAMRQIAAEFKLSAAQQLLSELHQQGHAVVLFSAFVAPLQLLHQRIGGELMTGRQRPLERQQSVDRFQQGKSNCLLATYGTGSLGFTLHRARHVVLLERPWTPGDLEQAEDRCHRLGMGDGLTCHWLQLGPSGSAGGWIVGEQGRTDRSASRSPSSKCGASVVARDGPCLFAGGLTHLQFMAEHRVNRSC